MKKLKVIAAVLGLSVLFAACAVTASDGNNGSGSGNAGETETESGNSGESDSETTTETQGEIIDRDSELKNIQIIPIELDKEYELTDYIGKNVFLSRLLSPLSKISSLIIETKTT